ncbi:hypothetical protein KC573_02850, partial [candidate division WWE3 bacterium]|nr:hypothetical protein [candidate division WWE3 bacterium]
SRVFIGAIIVIIGVIFLTDTLGITGLFGLNAGEIIGTLWPIILIAVGLNLFTKQKSSVGIVLTGLGLLFLASNIFNINVFATLWPLFIIFIGISILLGKPFNRFEASQQTTSEAKLNTSAIFWGVEQRVTTQNFQGGKVDAIFGGAEIDLRNAKVSPNGATLEINAIFGGVEIHVSTDTYRVEVAGDGIVGGWENNFNTTSSSELPLLKIKGVAVFGGVTVTN